MSGFTDIGDPVEDGAPEQQSAESQSPAEDILNLMGDQQEPNQAEAQATETVSEEAPLEEPLEQLGQDTSRTDEEHPQEQTQEQDGPTFTIKVNGEDRDVTLEELQAGFLRQSDYTRKTQDIATRESELNQAAQFVNQQQQQYDQMLQTYQEQLQGLIPPEPNWAELAQRNPAEATRQKAAWDQLQGQLKKVQEERQSNAQKMFQAQQQQFSQYAQTQAQSLVQAKPELQDQQKMQEFFTDLNTYATNHYGFTPQELGNPVLSDHRFALILDKARAYDAAQQGATAKQQAEPAVPTLRPGPAQRGGNPAAANIRNAKMRLARSGKTSDAAELIEGML